jgi:hypothetical protein
VTDYVAGLVARGLGRTPGPVLEPRLGPEVLADSPEPRASARVEPAPATVGEIVETRVAALRHAPVNDPRPDPPRVEAPRAGRRRRAAELAPALKVALVAGEPTLVDIVCQPLQEAKAPVSEWVA